MASGKGFFVLLRTSNPGSAAWQLDTGIAERVRDWVAARTPSTGHSAIGVVVGATLPADEVRRWRSSLARVWWLVPGFGAQGAGSDDVRPHFEPDGLGALVTSSREVIFPKSGFDDQPTLAIAERARRFAEAVRLASPRRLR
jgi:orotidine-5'-phosphate decarboxylase